MVKYTTAGRLLAEVHRIERIIRAGPEHDPLHLRLADMFGGAERHWSRGAAAYDRLLSDAKAEIPLLIESRRQRYIEAIASASTVIQPIHFQSQAKGFADQVLVPLLIERLESMDEALQGLGHSFDVDEERARSVQDELDELINQIKSGEALEIDAFLLDRLQDLRDVLRKYILYGPAGVESHVAAVVGCVVIRGGGAMPKANIQKTLLLMKNVLDVLAYVNTAKDTLEWAGPLLLQSFGS